jgi:hypothetical protein
MIGPLVIVQQRHDFGKPRHWQTDRARPVHTGAADRAVTPAPE